MMSEQMRAFALFVLGAVLCAVAIEMEAFARPVTGADRAMLCSAFFGLPYLFWEFTRKINWLIVLYLAFLISVYFYIAYLIGGAVAEQMNPSNAAIPAGAAGGLAGGALCLFTLRLGSLAGPGATSRTALIGTAVLTLVGGLGAYLASGGNVSPVWALLLPWQIALGWFISRMLRISPRRGEAEAA